MDTTLRSAAYSHGQRVIGVILSGTLDDGTAGVLAVRMHGGRVVVQDPSDALYDGMPRNALSQVTADHVLPAAKIGPALAMLTEELLVLENDPSGGNPNGEAEELPAPREYGTRGFRAVKHPIPILMPRLPRRPVGDI